MRKAALCMLGLLVVLIQSGCRDQSPFGPKLVPADEDFPSWQPGTNIIASSSYGATSRGDGVQLIDLDRPERRLLLPGCYGPIWSSDGRLLACRDFNSIVVFDAASRVTYRVPRAEPAVRVCWSPDGTSLLGEMSGEGAPLGLWIFDASGSEMPRRVTPYGMRAGMASWSAARDEIVFVSSGDGDDAALFLIRPDGTELRQITHTPDEFESYPRWSPDGRSIAYSGRHGIWILDVSSLRAHPLEGTDAPGLATYQTCTWSSDGKRLVYNKATLWVIDVTGQHNHEIK